MPSILILNELLDYTEWERQRWRDFFIQNADALQTSAGPNGDGRFQSVGELVRHIFSAETRYIDRLTGKPLTDTSLIPADNLDAIFQFGSRSRAALRDFLAQYPADKWEAPEELKMGAFTIHASPRKIVIHIVMHEIRHWAQIATLLRMNGFKFDFHDFLFSPVLGGQAPRAEAKA